MTRIVGTPRKKSAYTTERARSGKKTGPGRPRRIAMPSAKTRISASAIRKILMLSRNALGMTSSDSSKTSRLKKASFTAGQPDAFVISRTATTAKTIVLAAAISVLRVPERPRAITELLEDRRSRAFDPLRRDLVERARVTE